MIKSSKSKLTLLILMSIMLNLALAGYKAAPGATCTQGETNCFKLFNAVDGTLQGFKIILPANQVTDCFRYYDDGQCFCDSTASFAPIEITVSNSIKFGCVPIADRKINGVCTYTAPTGSSTAGTYSCLCTATDYTNLVSMMVGTANNNPDSIAEGCSKYTPTQVPCTKSKIITYGTLDLNLLATDSDNDGWTIECGQCAASGQVLATFTTSATQPITKACIVNIDSSQGFLRGCNLYTYAATLANIICNTCQTGKSYAIIQSSSASTPICTTGALPTNCLKYFASAVSGTTAPTCYDCSVGYKKIVTQTGLTIQSSSITTTGTCSEIPLAGYCDAYVIANQKKICLYCKKGYTILYSTTGALPVCAPSIENCAFLLATGCSACVKGYQLINNACLDLPSNCEKIDAKSACIQCKSGFATNSDGKCVPTNANTCPAGQVPSNGVCVPVQVTIADCVSYTTESKCDRCVEGKIPSDDGLSCVFVRANTDRPGAKPCPPNTSSVTYRRNPSDPLGDCVAVDVQCAGSRDDGFCYSCKNGEYAHSDGKCYKVTLTDEGN